jgi:ATP-binding cassette subfamily B protein RaxB
MARAKRRLRLQLQSESAECGLACLAMILSYYGFQTNVATLRQHFPVSLSGQSVRSLIGIADKMGLNARALRVGPGRLPDIHLPAIVHWEMNHFVVLKALNAKTATVLDPGAGERVVSYEELLRKFTGIVVELEPNSYFSVGETKSDFTISSLWSQSRGLVSSSSSIVVLSLIGQLIIVIIPFLIGGMIDVGVASGSREILLILAGVMFALYSLAALNRYARDLSIFHFGIIFHSQVGGNLFRHMLSLPLSFYEKRNPADIISKFEGVRAVRTILSQGLLNSVLDAIFFFVILALSFAMSGILTSIFFITFAMVAAVKLSFMRSDVQRQEELINAEDKAAHHMMESVRGMSTVRLGGFESIRRSEWQTLFEAAAGVQERIQRSLGIQNVVVDVLRGAEHVLVLLIGAFLALQGEVTVGVLFAILAYRQQFYDRAYPLLDAVKTLRVIRLHLARLSDVISTQAEERRGNIQIERKPLTGAIALRGVSYRYDEAGSWIIRSCDIEFKPAELTVVIGPSGAGKTTFVKILLGLLRPSEGGVFIDGVDIEEYGLSDFRSQVGAMMQSDTLLTGSISRNIAAFQGDVDIERVRECARLADIEDEIDQFPMRFDSLVGGGGSVLSEGQKQRVMLARALYKNPSILILDEGTANLDPISERVVLDNLRSTGLGILAITHRPGILKSADRILHVDRGAVIEIDLETAIRLMEGI